MKIGILTYHRAHNFGAVLQAYALYTYLKDLGHEPEMVDYWPEYRSGQYDLFNFNYYIKSADNGLTKLKTLVKRTMSFPERSVRHIKFEKFIKNQFKVSNRRFIVGEQIEDFYDLIICGSDQIWRYNKISDKNSFDSVYFGKFPLKSKAIKISYAASMGVEVTSKEALNEFSKNLTYLDSISVRESSLLSLLKTVSDKPAIQVLDPIFLLSKESWLQKVKSKRTKPYLLFYHLLYCEDAVNISKQVAEDKGLQIIEIRGKIEPFMWGKQVITTAGPIDFISLIADSEYVVSTSFHGVAFAILFGKQFSAMGFKNNASRVLSLLNSLGIERALLEDLQKKYCDDINYKEVNSRLNEFRNESYGFLSKHLRLKTQPPVDNEK